MHYYQHNIGDYRRDTAHLSLLEHGVYRQLLDMYYLNESPMTADLNQIFRKLCARSQEEKDSVEIILNEFFKLTDSGWTHKRCDEEIEEYSIQNEDNRAREDNEKERQRRHRDERKRLFSELREKGQIPKWDIAIDQLRDLHKQHCNQSSSLREHTCNAPVTEQERFCNEPATAITKEPINQEPLTINQSKEETHTYYPSQQSRDKNENNSQKLSGDPPQAEPKPPPGKPTPAASVCLAIKKIGIIDVNPSHPELLMLIEAGATIDEFVYAARTAKDKSKGFAYILGTVKGQRSEAAQAKDKVLKGRIPNKADAILARNNESIKNWKPPELRAQND